jgi:serine/threonine protein kinase
VNGPGGKPGERLVPGTYLAGYRLEERIGRGGQAVVFRAMDEQLGRPVAMKILAPGLTSDHAFRTRFINESHAAAAVEHPHILPVYDAGEASGLLFIAMRYVPGGDVRSLVRKQGQLSVRRGWNIVAQIASALDAAHQLRLVHRDVKPANMLLDSSGRLAGASRADHAYLTDFGISKQAQSVGLTVVGQIMGTLEYAAPEQLDGEPVDSRTDVYALACSTFELLTGEPPFRQRIGPALIYAQLQQAPPSLVQRRPELASAVDLVLAKAMAKVPADRYPTCGGYAADLGRALHLIGGQVEAAAGARPAWAAATLKASRRPGQETRVVHHRPPAPPTGPVPPAPPAEPAQPAQPAQPEGNEPTTQRRYPPNPHSQSV